MLGLVGISFKSADLEIRECFSFTVNDIEKMTSDLSARVSGLVVLSTCNRTEIYYHCSKSQAKEAVESVLQELTEMKNYAPTMSHHFYFKQGNDVISHLFHVVSGIDSLIVGEDQIIGQVKEAFYRAEKLNSTNKILTRLFTKSFEVGKKVRTQTQIGKGSASASSAAVNLCLQYHSDLSQLNVMMIGAGQTGQLVLNSLRKSKFNSLIIANRTLEKAQELARIHGGNAIELNQVEKFLPQTDILFVATDSQTNLITKDMAQQALQNRNADKKPLYLDLSVPRNIDKNIDSMENIMLYTIDDLQQIVESTNQKRMQEISSAEKIIQKAEKHFIGWKNDQELVPTIMKIKESFSQLNKQEMDEFYRNRSIQQHELLEEYAQLLSDKFARTFIKNLKSISKDADNKTFIEMAEDFFELKE
ncbi:MAG: glutamyl-tRNA reductase [Bacteroidales bacterium]|nr:glutamyl-tRNA reductase [Bacteroidales bacterium]